MNQKLDQALLLVKSIIIVTGSLLIRWNCLEPGSTKVARAKLYVCDPAMFHRGNTATGVSKLGTKDLSSTVVEASVFSTVLSSST